MRTWPRLVLGFAALSLASLPAGLARAEDAAPPSEASEKKDDKNIITDLKLINASGSTKFRKERAEYWQKRSETGTATEFPKRWTFHLAKVWQAAFDYEKAAATFVKFIETPPAPDDPKAATDFPANKKVAQNRLIELYFRLKQYPKAIEVATKWVQDYPDDGAVVAEVWDGIGQSNRANGDEDKAIEAFAKSAEQKFIRGYADLIDVHLAAGNLDAAKAAHEKYSGELAEKYKDIVAWEKSLLDAIGSDAPSLEKVVSVAPTEAPKAWSETTILFRFGMQTPAFDGRLEKIQALKLKYSSKCVAVGLATYQHYNVYSRKVEPGLSTEDELKGFRELLGQSPKRIPAAIVVEPEFLDALKAKFEGTILIVDEKGKLRWARINEEKPYDSVSAEIALKRVIGEK